MSEVLNVRSPEISQEKTTQNLLHKESNRNDHVFWKLVLSGPSAIHPHRTQNPADIEIKDEEVLHLDARRLDNA
jgi:hypothetical protein